MSTDTLYSAMSEMVDIEIEKLEAEMVRTEDKVREDRVRRMAARQGLTLRKCPRRDPHALGYGTYMLVDTSTGGIVAQSGIPGGYGLDLDTIEQELTKETN